MYSSGVRIPATPLNLYIMDAENIKVETVKYIRFRVGVYYWEDCWIDGYQVDEEDGSIVPFATEDGEWDFILDLDNGRILGWDEEVLKRCPDVKGMSTYFKACDMVYRTMLDANLQPLHEEYRGYVPKILDFNDKDGHYGFGDYVGLTINRDGTIQDWPKDNLEFFIRDLLQELYNVQQEKKKEELKK